MTVEINIILLVVIFLVGWGIGIFMGLLVTEDPLDCADELGHLNSAEH